MTPPNPARDEAVQNLRTQIAALAVGCCTCGSKSHDKQWHLDGCKVWNVAYALDALDDLASAPAPASGVDAVAVKALEWVEEQRRGTFIKYFARTPFGGYEVNSEFTATTEGGPMVCPPDWKGPLDSSGRRAVSVDEAKAAAQSDYEQRIRSALSPAATSAHIANCGENREAKMVVLRTDETGKPTVWCDPCIAPIVKAFSEAGIATVSSCCGHSHRPGVIGLKDGRVLMLLDNFEDYQRVEALWTTDINGAATSGSDGEPEAWEFLPREMSDEMMDAGQTYLNEKSLNGRFTLPGGFNWHEFWRVVVAQLPTLAKPSSPAGYVTITTNGTTRTIPADEPVFLIRGQDVIGGAAVRAWATLAEASGADFDMCQIAREHAAKMDEWPKKKVADLPKQEDGR